MEIFITNVDYFATRHEVIRAIAEKLHVSETSIPLNFHVRLLKPDKGIKREHKGCGILTLPSEDVGRRFLKQHSGGSSKTGRHAIVVRGRKLVFLPSRNKPSKDILESIRTRPYLDPGIAEGRERTAKLLQTLSIPICSIQFGWDCRDNVFSVEWEYLCPGSKLSFNSDKQQIEITVGSEQKPNRSSEFPELQFLIKSVVDPSNSSPPATCVVLSATQVEYIASELYSSTEPIIFFSLLTPAIFLVDNLLPPPLRIRKRLPYLPVHGLDGRPHHEIAKYVSLSLRLVCNRAEHLETFGMLAERAGFKVNEWHYPIERRNLFSSDALRTLREWLEGIPFSAAFQIERLLRNHSLDPSELLLLREDVDLLIAESADRGYAGEEHLIAFFHEFGLRVSSLYWKPGENGNIRDHFLQARSTFASASPTSFLNGTDNIGLFLCFHVIVTPTSLLLEGPLPERSNRVIRSYPQEFQQNFTRVSFFDEGKLQLGRNAETDVTDFVEKRVGPILREGFQLAGQHFFFLGYSQSSLKEHSVWFLRPFVMDGRQVHVSDVIDGIGQFSNLSFDPRLQLCPARLAARISQGFTATDPTTTEVDMILEIDDIATVDPKTGIKWIHTDGVGTMSPAVSRTIGQEYRRRRGRSGLDDDYARALQVRIMGSKGVLSVDHTLSGMTICLSTLR